MAQMKHLGGMAHVGMLVLSGPVARVSHIIALDDLADSSGWPIIGVVGVPRLRGGGRGGQPGLPGRPAMRSTRRDVAQKVPVSDGPATAVPFARVEIVPEAQQAALRVLRSGWITMGPETLGSSTSWPVTWAPGTWSRSLRARPRSRSRCARCISRPGRSCSPRASRSVAPSPHRAGGPAPGPGRCGPGTLLPTPATVARRPAGWAGRTPWSSSTWPATRPTCRN